MATPAFLPPAAARRQRSGLDQSAQPAAIGASISTLRSLLNAGANPATVAGVVDRISEAARRDERFQLEYVNSATPYPNGNAARLGEALAAYDVLHATGVSADALFGQVGAEVLEAVSQFVVRPEGARSIYEFSTRTLTELALQAPTSSENLERFADQATRLSTLFLPQGQQSEVADALQEMRESGGAPGSVTPGQIAWHLTDVICPESAAALLHDGGVDELRDAYQELVEFASVSDVLVPGEDRLNAARKQAEGRAWDRKMSVDRVVRAAAAQDLDEPPTPPPAGPVPVIDLSTQRPPFKERWKSRAKAAVLVVVAGVVTLLGASDVVEDRKAPAPDKGPGDSAPRDPVVEEEEKKPPTVIPPKTPAQEYIQAEGGKYKLMQALQDEGATKEHAEGLVTNLETDPRQALADARNYLELLGPESTPVTWRTLRFAGGNATLVGQVDAPNTVEWAEEFLPIYESTMANIGDDGNLSPNDIKIAKKSTERVIGEAKRDRSGGYEPAHLDNTGDYTGKHRAPDLDL